MQPRLMVKRVIGDLVTSIGYHPNGIVILFKNRILPNDKNGDLQIPLLKKVDKSRHTNIEVARERFPQRIAGRFEVGPFVVQIQRYTGKWFFIIQNINRQKVMS